MVKEYKELIPTSIKQCTQELFSVEVPFIIDKSFGNKMKSVILSVRDVNFTFINEAVESLF